MPASEILSIIIRGDAAGAIRALDQAGQAAGAAANRWDAAGRQMSRIGAGMTAGLTVPLLGVGVASVEAASNLNEQMNKANTVFGRSATVVQSFAETAVDSFGISERAALEAAGNYGNMAVSLGVSQQAAAEMAVELTGLAGDLSSFNNIATDDALEKLRSGLAGEVEPLRALGVSFNAAQVDAEAMNVAIADGRNEITEADKVLARYHLIVEQTGTAQGDFARTSDSLANQQRRATAELENSAAALGQSLLPVAADAAGMIADLAGWFSNLPGPVQDTIVKLGLFVAAAGPVLFIGGKLISTFSNFSAALKKVSVTQAASTAAVGLAAAVFISYTQRVAEAAQRTEDYKNALASSTTEIERLQATGETLAQTLGDDARLLDDAGVSLAQFISAAREGADVTDLSLNANVIQTWSREVATGARDVDAFSEALGRAHASGELTTGELQRLVQMLQLAQSQVESGTAAWERERENQLAAAEAAFAASVAQEDLAAAASIAGGAVTGLADAQEGLSSGLGETAEAAGRSASNIEDSERAVQLHLRASNDAAAAVNEYVASLEALNDQFQSVTEASIDVFDATDAVSRSIEENGRTLDLATDAGRRNTETVLDVADSWLGLAEAQARAGESQATVNDTIEYGREALIGQLEALGLTRDAAEEYADGLGLIPETVNTRVNLNAPSTAEAEAVGTEIEEGVARGVDRSEELNRSVRNMIDGALAIARQKAEIQSPSRRFAVQVGKPISEGVAQGILDAADEPGSAIDQLMSDLEQRALDGVSSITSGIGDVLGRQSAQVRLGDAEQKLAELRREQLGLPARQAEAERLLEEARAGGASEREIADASQAVVDARVRAETITRDIEDAELDLTQAQLAAVRAQQALIEAGNEWLDQGPEAEANFRAIAQSAGLSAEAVERLVAQLRAAAYVAQNGPQLEAPSDALAGGAAAPDFAAVAQGAVFQQQAIGVFRSRLAEGQSGQIARYLSGGDEGVYNRLLDQYTQAYHEVAFAVSQEEADRLAGMGLTPDEFEAAADAVVNASRRASGGRVAAGRPYIVNERSARGAEIFVPDVAGTVLPRLPSMAGGGGGGVRDIIINLPPGADGEQVVASIDRYVKRGGSLPPSMRR